MNYQQLMAKATELRAGRHGRVAQRAVLRRELGE